MSNGYFILNSQKVQALGLSRVDVDIIAHKRLPTGTYQEVTTQSLSITTPKFFGKANMDLIEALGEGEWAHYRLRGYNANNNVVLDYHAYGGGQPWPMVCREVCNSLGYAWALDVYQLQGQTYIEINNGTVNGSYHYFYVKGSDWNQFKVSNPHPNNFGLNPWSQYDGPPGTVLPSDEVFKLTTSPQGARGLNGYPIVTTGPVWAIRKDRGPWRNLYAFTDPPASGNYCNMGAGFIKDVYNNNGAVQSAMLTQGLGPLTCTAQIVGGGATTWGNEGSTICTAINFTQSVDSVTGEVDVVDWMIDVIECPELDDPPGVISSVSSVVVNRWSPTSRAEVLNVKIPDVNDPRLVPIPQTRLDPGLYEVLIVLKNGKIIRHFEDFNQHVTLNAEFASFVDITIYPVPVTNQRFSVDFNLVAPMNINMTVVNNVGVPYHSKLLQYNMAGLNKYVVRMDPAWPAGVYHCLFQYTDGSSESMSILVK